jgi:heme exporter protein D
MNVAEFFHMGGYAPYVWGAYGLAFVVLLGNALAAWHRRRKLIREISVQLQNPEGN